MFPVLTHLISLDKGHVRNVQKSPFGPRKYFENIFLEIFTIQIVHGFKDIEMDLEIFGRSIM